MHFLLLMFVVASSAVPLSQAPTSSKADDTATCTSRRLAKFVGPLGVDQPWPTVESLPSDAELSQPIVLADANDARIADGFIVTLQVSAKTNSAYVISRGGFAGLQKIFGPLPVASCRHPTSGP
jgi:hypothetical protein